MRTWPIDGWIADMPAGFLGGSDGAVERREGGYLAMGSDQDARVTWLDDRGGLVCSCGAGDRLSPCMHGRILLARVEAYRTAKPLGHLTVARRRDGLRLVPDQHAELLARYHSEDQRDQANVFKVSDRIVLHSRGDWWSMDANLAAVVVSTLQPIPDTGGGVRVPEGRLADLLDLQDQGTIGLEGVQTRAMRRLPGVAGSSVIHPVEVQGASLDPAQIQGIAWMGGLAEAGLGGILADEMGVGKTLEIIGHVLATRSAGRLDRAVIATPSGSIDHWAREFRSFAPDIDILVWEGAQRDRLLPIFAASPVVLTTHRLFVLDAHLFRSHDWTILAIDEAQDANSASSDLAVACALLPSEQKIPVTGTPVENTLMDLHTLATIAVPGLLGRAAHFRRDVAEPVRRGREDADEIISALHRSISPYLLHRTQADAGLSIPKPLEHRTAFPLDRDHDAYEFLAKEARQAILSSPGGIFRHITLLRQAAADPRLVTKDVDSTEGTKTRILADRIADDIRDGRQVLLFSTWRSHLDLLSVALERRGIDPRTISRIDGTLGRRQRRWAEEDFKSGRSRVLQATMRAGGRSLNFPEADKVCIATPWWNPAVMRQAAYRAIRRGQTKTIEVDIPIALATIEERLMETQDEKARTANGILRPHGMRGGLTRREMERLVHG